MYVYIYIYIYRERERERERCIHTFTLGPVAPNLRDRSPLPSPARLAQNNLKLH